VSSLARRWRALTLGSIAFVLIVVIAWLLAGQASGQLTTGIVVRTAVFAVPLLLPLRGLLRSKRYTYRWATLCVLPYFVVALTEAFANPAARFYATALLAASILWFISLVAFLRVTEPPRELLN
jgi:uncharacterized membrane protein